MLSTTGDGGVTRYKGFLTRTSVDGVRSALTDADADASVCGVKPWHRGHTQVSVTNRLKCNGSRKFVEQTAVTLRTALPA